nr:FtsX-like permease family protein [Acidobacteriota bacterium]
NLALALMLLPPCANIAILNYARIVTRQQEFAARHALGGSRARILWQLFLESLVLTTAAAAVALVIVRLVSVVVAGRLQTIPGGPPFWMHFDVSFRTVLFAAGLAVVGAAMSGLMPALHATRRVAQLGAGALAGRTSVRLGATWTVLVIAQVAFSVGVLPIAAELAWGTLRTGLLGPGFAAEEYASARVTLADGAERPSADRVASRHRELVQQLRADPAIAGVATALQAPGAEPWVTVDIEGGNVPAFGARLNQVDAEFFNLYQVQTLTGRRFVEGDAGSASTAVIVNRNFAEGIAPGGDVLGRRFKYAHAAEKDWPHGPAPERWYEVVGVVGNLPVSTDARVVYHAAVAGQMNPLRLQMRTRGTPDGLSQRLSAAAVRVDTALHVDDVRSLAEIYREHRFGDNLGALTIGAVTGSLLLLSAAGLYALMAFTVAQRRREIGIRTALGAPAGQLVAAVFKRALQQVGVGAAVGLLAAFLIRRYVPIEEVGGLSIPGILPMTALFMLLVGALASIGPVRRGLRIEPTEALRGQ